MSNETPQPDRKRAVLYTRLGHSRDGYIAQRKQEQGNRLLQFALDNGYEIAGQYADVGPAMSNMYEGPGIRLLLDRVEAGDIGTVLIPDLPTLTRNLTCFQQVRAHLDQLGVQIVSVDNLGRGLSEDTEDLVKAIAAYLIEGGMKQVRWYAS